MGWDAGKYKVLRGQCSVFLPMSVVSQVGLYMFEDPKHDGSYSLALSP